MDESVEINIRKEIANRLKNILKERKMTQQELSGKLDKDFKYGTSQSSVSRFLDGKHDQSATFIYFFCKMLGLSADYVFGTSENAYESQNITPQIVLNNLVLLLNQFNFNIEFNDNHSKAMLTTDDEHMIKFLHVIQATKMFTLEPIEDFCKTNNLVMSGKNLLSQNDLDKFKQLYVDYEVGKFNEPSDLSSLEYEEEIQFRLQRLGVTLPRDQVDIKDIASLEWEKSSNEEKVAKITVIREYRQHRMISKNKCALLHHR